MNQQECYEHNIHFQFLADMNTREVKLLPPCNIRDLKLLPPQNTRDVKLLPAWNISGLKLLPHWSTSDVKLLPLWNTRDVKLLEGRRSKPPNSIFDDFDFFLQMTRTMKAAHVQPTFRPILPFFMIEKPHSLSKNFLSPLNCIEELGGFDLQQIPNKTSNSFFKGFLLK